ncbi:MAG: DNA alkylation repair protein, partial [Myxococcales bacterium]|nr:DNA alkylation repair protein [Myxococcales bacterium]
VATPERAASEKAYLKSALKHLGVTVPETRRIAKAFLKANPDLDRAGLRALVRALWAGGVFELRSVAVEMMNARSRLLEAADVDVLEEMLRDAHTWALVDSLATNVIADLVERYPALNKTLDRWSEDEDFWLRRTSMLALLPPMREGRGDFARFARYADTMLEEKEFFIRKAIGWILRDVSRHHADDVWTWLAPRAHRASGVTVSEAVKRLPRTRAEAILTAYRTKQPIA